MYPMKATVDAATNKCVSDLTANAQFFGCLFEDDAGKAEDKQESPHAHVGSQPIELLIRFHAPPVFGAVVYTNHRILA